MLRRLLRRSVPGLRGVVAALLLGAALAMATFCVLYSTAAELLLPPPRPPSPPRAQDQYTLPSLDEVLQSSQDLDLQRVLRHYRSQHQQVPLDTPPVRLLLASSWRSGSTLMGEVLASHPGVYYHYEPFMPHGLRLLGDGDKEVVNELLTDLFRCDYRRQEEYLRFAFVNADLFSRNIRLWSMCSSLPRTKCYAPDTLGKLCGLFPIHLAKMVRARLSPLEKQLSSDPRVKLVWLVRDPRAVINSRRSNVDWCNTPSCKEPSLMCSSLYEDYVTFLVFKERYPKKVMLVRYEDLARDAYNKSRQVLEFVGLSLHSDVVAYLDDHLSTNVDLPWSTKHEPKATMSRWLKSMSWEEVDKVQRSCAHYMKALGYRIFENPNEMSSGNAVGLLNIPK